MDKNKIQLNLLSTKQLITLNLFDTLKRFKIVDFDKVIVDTRGTKSFPHLTTDMRIEWL